jgi:quercetin dioxygenase-like cupin family protein
MELSKNFCYEGERHDFWEMVYIDKGEMICTADKNRFVLKSGEMTFHKPNEFHNLSGNNSTPPKSADGTRHFLKKEILRLKIFPKSKNNSKLPNCTINPHTAS